MISAGDLADAFVPLAVVNVLPVVKSRLREALKLDRVFRQPVSFHKSSLFTARNAAVRRTAFADADFYFIIFFAAVRQHLSFPLRTVCEKAAYRRAGLFESVRRFPTQAASAGYNFQSSARSRSAASAVSLRFPNEVIRKYPRPAPAANPPPGVPTICAFSRSGRKIPTNPCRRGTSPDVRRRSAARVEDSLFVKRRGQNVRVFLVNSYRLRALRTSLVGERGFGGTLNNICYAVEFRRLPPRPKRVQRHISREKSGRHDRPCAPHSGEPRRF